MVHLHICLDLGTHMQVVNRWVTKVQDHKEPHFIMLADLVLALHQEQLLSTSDVVEGLRETMESMAVSMDHPRSGGYITAFLVTANIIWNVLTLM